jgi:hypothetical protein
MSMIVLIPGSVQLQARSFAVGMTSAELAKKVYLNTLAVYAVQSWLEEVGIETHWPGSDSWQPNLATPIDAADLEIVGVGRVECRPVLLGQQSRVEIPPLVVGERQAYIAVGFGEMLDRAELMGFVYEYRPEVTTLSLREFRRQSLESLPSYLANIRRVLAALEIPGHPLAEAQALWPDRSISALVARLESIFQLETDPDLQNRKVQGCLQEDAGQRSLVGAALSDEVAEDLGEAADLQALAVRVADWFRQTRL